jgi:hypothetical protein
VSTAGGAEEGRGAAAGGPEETPSAEELAAAFAERLARTPVRDLLLQTMATFADVAGIRLGLGPRGEEARDLPQARQAIEVLRALVGVAESQLGAALARPFREPLAALQLAYARAAEGPAPEAAERAEAGAGQPPADDPASRLWTPPGTRRPGRPQGT